MNSPHHHIPSDARAKAGCFVDDPSHSVHIPQKAYTNDNSTQTKVGVCNSFQRTCKPRLQYSVSDARSRNHTALCTNSCFCTSSALTLYSGALACPLPSPAAAAALPLASAAAGCFASIVMEPDAEAAAVEAAGAGVGLSAGLFCLSSAFLPSAADAAVA